jgi:hypothetical protein
MRPSGNCLFYATLGPGSHCLIADDLLLSLKETLRAANLGFSRPPG